MCGVNNFDLAGRSLTGDLGLANDNAMKQNKEELERINRRRNGFEYQIGDEVYVERSRRGKEESLRKGSRKVIESRANGNNPVIRN